MRYFQVAPIDQPSLIAARDKIRTMAPRRLHSQVRLLIVGPMSRQDSGRRMVLAFDDADPVQAEEIALVETFLTEVYPWDEDASRCQSQRLPKEG
jgi:hypothetical protein